MKFGENIFRFIGFLLTLGGLLLVTSPTRYADSINQIALKLVNTQLATDQIALIGLVTLAIGLYTIFKMR